MTYLLHPSKVLKVLSMNRLRTGETKVWVCVAFLGLESRLVAEWVHNSCIQKLHMHYSNCMIKTKKKYKIVFLGEV